MQFTITNSLYQAAPSPPGLEANYTYTGVESTASFGFFCLSQMSVMISQDLPSNQGMHLCVNITTIVSACTKVLTQVNSMCFVKELSLV